MANVHLDQATSPTDIVLTPAVGSKLKLVNIPTSDPGVANAVWKDSRGGLIMSPGTAIGSATDAAAGIVELATNAEALTGTDTARAVTPAGLKAAISAIPSVAAATETSSGVVELATVAEAVAGVDMTRAIHAYGLAAALAAGGTGAPINSPAFTGNPTAPTPAPGDNDTSIATTAFVTAAIASIPSGPTPHAEDIAFTPAGGIAAIDVQAALEELDIEKADGAATTAALALLAPLANPIFTGDARAPTPTLGDNDTSIATTAFVTAAIAAIPPSSGVKTLVVACSDETTALTAGTGKVTFRMPYAMTVTGVRASLTIAQTSGSTFTVDINDSGTSILSTKLTIDNTEKTSTTAATPAVVSDTALADDAEITVDIDVIGDGTAKGLKITLIGI